MHVLCAWCRQADQPALLEERPPFRDEQTSYGICPSHRLEFLILRYLRAPAGR